MQIAAMNPVAIDPSTVSSEVVEREKGIIVDLIKNDPKMAGKPDEMISKIADGKLNSFFNDSLSKKGTFLEE